MNAPVFTQDNLLFSVITPLGENQLLFKSLQGEEFLSELFHFNIEMLSERKDLDFHKVVGKPLAVKIQYAPEHTRYLNGIVTRFSQAGSDVRFTTYHAEIRPWLWLLTLTKNSQIFQNLSVPQIIKQVFDQLGFTDYRMELAYGYEKRVYCVQYEETAFNFISRLMEDEGIFYFFEHTETQHILILADDLGVHQDCPGISTARFWTQNTQEVIQSEDVVTVLESVGQVRTIQYAVDDFNFETPRADLILLASATENSILKNTIFNTDDSPRIYEYAAGFEKMSQGERKVRLRLESCTADAKLVEGQGHCFSFIPGYRFTLTRHPRPDLNATYVLRWVSHSLSLTHYSNSFRAAPWDIPFRPPVITQKPRIVGSQTAIVTGPAGEEIWTDKYGRVKVQFHWDQKGQRDDKSSCWIRVNQGWGGKGWGNICLPRIGQEVIVSFLEGDPDRPILTGGVFNAEQTVPYALPEDQNKMTFKSNSTPGGGGFNEIRLDDSKDNEEIFMHGQKDWNTVIENDLTLQVGHDETMTVDHDRTRTVHHDETITIDNNRTKHIKNNQKETVDTNNTITVGKNQSEKVGRNKSEFVGVTSAETVGIAKALTVGAAYQVSVGGIMNETVGGMKSVQVGFSKSEIVGGSHSTQADEVIIEAKKQIVLKCAGSTITLDSGGNIIIKSAAQVLINT